MSDRLLDNLEEDVMQALVANIRDCTDPVDQFKLIERYEAFVVARAKRIASESGFPQAGEQLQSVLTYGSKRSKT